jgi:hypothetical protein
MRAHTSDGGREQKSPPPVKQWRVSFGRHTKMGYGGHEIAQVTTGGRRLTKEEYDAALQKIINEDIKALRNFHGMFCL